MRDGGGVVREKGESLPYSPDAWTEPGRERLTTGSRAKDDVPEICVRPTGAGIPISSSNPAVDRVAIRHSLYFYGLGRPIPAYPTARPGRFGTALPPRCPPASKSPVARSPPKPKKNRQEPDLACHTPSIFPE